MADLALVFSQSGAGAMIADMDRVVSRMQAMAQSTIDAANAASGSRGIPAINKAIDKLPAATGSIDHFKDELERLKNQFKATGSAIERAHIGPQIAALERQIEHANSAIPQATKSMGSAFKDFATQTMATFGPIAIATTVVAFGKKSVEAFAEFETGLNSLSAITGAVGADLKFFSDEAKRIGETTTIGATDAVRAFELIGSAKPELLKSKEALASVTNEAIKLAEASGMSLPDAAASAVGALNQYGAAADQAGRFVNVLAAGALEGASPIQASTQALEQFGSVANGFNVSIEESIALVQTLADKNKMGAEAGTALRNVLLKMQTIKALDRKAVEDLERLGVNMDLVSNAALPVADRLEELKKIGGDATAMMHVFGTENINAANILLTNTERFEGLTKAITGTNAATKQQATQTQGLAASWKKIQNQIQNVMIEIGAAIAPVLREITDGFAPAFKIVKELFLTIYTPMYEVIKSFGGLFTALGLASGEGNKFVGVVKVLAGAIEFLTLPTRIIYKVLGGIVEVVTWVVEKFMSARDAVYGFAEGIPGATTALKVLEGVIKFTLAPLLLLKDAWDYLFGAKAAPVDSKLSAEVKQLTNFAKELGGTQAQIDQFQAGLKQADFVGLTHDQTIKKLTSDFIRWKAANEDATKAVLAAIPPTEDLAGTMADLTVKTGPAAGSIDFFNQKLQELQAAFSATGSDMQRNSIGKEIEKVEFQLLRFSAVVDEMKAKTGGIGGLVKDAGALPLPTMEEFDMDAMMSNLESGLPRVTAFGAAMTKVFEDLSVSVKNAMVSMAADVAFNIGEAIGSGGSIGDVFKAALRELAVMVPKMVGMAMLNQAATVPSPASLPLAIAGLALIGASGIISGAFKASDAKKAAAAAPNIGENSVPQPNRRGLESFGNEEQSAQKFILKFDSGEEFRFHREIQRGQIREGRKHG